MTESPVAVVKFDGIRSESLPERVCRQVIDAVRGGRLKAGQRLPAERELSDQFGVSRVVVREALRSLRAMGWVEVRPGKGTYVSRSLGATLAHAWTGWLARHRNEVLELLVLRQAIEQLAARQAATNATLAEIKLLRGNYEQFAAEAESIQPNVDRILELDLEFHELIAQAGHGQLLPKLVDELARILLESRRATFSFPGRPAVSAEDHRLILEAIMRRQPDAAAEAMFGHITNVIQVVAAIDTTPDESEIAEGF